MRYFSGISVFGRLIINSVVVRISTDKGNVIATHTSSFPRYCRSGIVLGDTNSSCRVISPKRLKIPFFTWKRGIAVKMKIFEEIIRRNVECYKRCESLLHRACAAYILETGVKPNTLMWSFPMSEVLTQIRMIKESPVLDQMWRKWA